MRIVLVCPEIPQNTGNVVRTCAALGAELVLVRPLGFSIQDRDLRRAGLDYWLHVPVTIWDDWSPLLDLPRSPLFFSSHGTKSLDEVSYHADDTLVFGSETSGLPLDLTSRYADRVVRIPMVDGRRCLNLAVAVGIAAYWGWGSLGFPGAARQL